MLYAAVVMLIRQGVSSVQAGCCIDAGRVDIRESHCLRHLQISGLSSSGDRLVRVLAQTESPGCMTLSA
jgi:hypothetical protein